MLPWPGQLGDHSAPPRASGDCPVLGVRFGLRRGACSHRRYSRAWQPLHCLSLCCHPGQKRICGTLSRPGQHHASAAAPRKQRGASQRATLAARAQPAPSQTALWSNLHVAALPARERASRFDAALVAGVASRTHPHTAHLCCSAARAMHANSISPTRPGWPAATRSCRRRLRPRRAARQHCAWRATTSCGLARGPRGRAAPAMQRRAPS